MSYTIAGVLQQARKGTPVSFQNLTMIPLHSDQPNPEPYLTMRTALEKGFVEIVEVSEGGHVPLLKVLNKSEHLVLLLDGEELKGAKQNRIVNTSILLGPMRETLIPVSCTEAGRWRYNSRSFKDSGHIMPAMSRMSKNARIHSSMERGRTFDADQGKIWDDVASYHAKLNTHSSSRAMSDAFEQRAQDLESFLKGLPLQPGQMGMVVLLNGKPIGGDLFLNAEAYATFHDKLVKSAAADALTSPTLPPPSQEDALIEAHLLLHSLEKAEETRFQPVGLGVDYRYRSQNSEGSALVHNDTLVHLNVYPTQMKKEPVPAARPTSTPVV
jgi:hypothetical protein